MIFLIVPLSLHRLSIFFYDVLAPIFISFNIFRSLNLNYQGYVTDKVSQRKGYHTENLPLC